MGTDYILTDDDKPDGRAQPGRRRHRNSSAHRRRTNRAREYRLGPGTPQPLTTRQRDAAHPNFLCRGKTRKGRHLRCRPFLMPGFVPTPGATTANAARAFRTVMKTSPAAGRAMTRSRTTSASAPAAATVNTTARTRRTRGESNPHRAPHGPGGYHAEPAQSCPHPTQEGHARRARTHSGVRWRGRLLGPVLVRRRAPARPGPVLSTTSFGCCPSDSRRPLHPV